MIFADDLRKPAWRCEWLVKSMLQRLVSYLVFSTVNVPEVDGNRVLAGLVGRNIANTMGCQVGMAMLIRRDLEFPGSISFSMILGLRWIAGSSSYGVPFIQAHCILDKQQGFVREQRRTKSCRQIKRLEEHLACEDETQISTMLGF